MISSKRKIWLYAASAVSVLCLSAGFIADRILPDPPVPVPNEGVGAEAERLLAEARESAGARENAPPSYTLQFATAGAEGAEGGRMLATSDEFGGVAEETPDEMDTLAALSGSKEPRIPPVHLTESSLKKKIALSEPEKPVRLNAREVLKPGENGGPDMGEGTMVSAPVDYLLFRSSATWKTFAESHKGRFPVIDFSLEHMLILVSVSDLPSGIFKLAGTKKAGKELLVLYRVDPLAMAAGPGMKEMNFYAAAAVPKDVPVKLQQGP